MRLKKAMAIHLAVEMEREAADCHGYINSPKMGMKIQKTKDKLWQAATTSEFTQDQTIQRNQEKSAINRFRWDWRSCCSVPHGMKCQETTLRGPSLRWGSDGWDPSVGCQGQGTPWRQGNRQESTCWAGWFVTAPEGAEHPVTQILNLR